MVYTTDIWRPHVVAATVVARDGRFLFVEESIDGRTVINQPAGHLDPGESLEAAAVRETLEETAHHVEPMSLVGVYMSRNRSESTGVDVTYVRFAFACRLVGFDPGRSLDRGIVRALWLTPDEIRARQAEHRSPLVLRTLEDYLAGRRFPLDLIYTHPSCVVSHV